MFTSGMMSAQTLVAACAQAAGDPARAVAELFHRLAHLGSKARVDLGVVVEHPRDRGRGDPGDAGHVDEGGHGCSMLLTAPWCSRRAPLAGQLRNA